ncbi:hypothetical protein [Leucobacter luti]|nr:hypothetical protein [Leucobacter luti]
MQLTTSMVYGGPDAVARFPLELKHALRDRFAEVQLIGIDTLDVMIRVGGLITPAEGDGGVHNLRRRSSDGRITANIVIPASELEHGGIGVVTGYLNELADRVGARLQAAGTPGTEATAQLRAAIQLAIADAAAS